MNARSGQKAQSRQFGQISLPLRRSRATVLAGKPLRTAGLFAGIGGIERGLGRAGHETTLLCENDPAAAEVLKHRFSEVQWHADVRELDELPRGTSLLTAGFPCQDLSQAGLTKGIAGSRSGLVGEVFRLVRKHEPEFVLLENVPFMLQLSKGRAMEVIVETFEAYGYQWAYRVVDSRAFGVPQRRRRVYFLASKGEDPRRILFADDAGTPEPVKDFEGRACGFYWTEGQRGLGWAVDAVPTLKGGSSVGIPSPPAMWLPNGEFIKLVLEDAERLQGFSRGWTRAAEKVGRRSSRWKLVGNAVTCQVSEWIGKRLLKPGEVLAVEELGIREGQTWPAAAWNVGYGRVRPVGVSEFPKQYRAKPLLDFISDARDPLSEKATAGFLERTKKGSLRFPTGFIAALEEHLERQRALKQAG